MALVVEDGSGKSDAESYVSVSDADTYVATNYTTSQSSYTSWDAAADATKEIALRRATQYVDARYDGNWRGYAYTTTQALAWPRTVAADNEDNYYDVDEIPQNLKDAVTELAVRIVAGDTLYADQSKPGTIKSKTVKAGVVEQSIEYQGGLSPAKKYPLVEALMKPLILVGGVLERG